MVERFGPMPQPSSWKFLNTPDMPKDIPMIFFWGNMSQGGLPATKDELPFSEDWLEYVNSTPNGRVIEVNSDHWITSRGAK